MSAFLRRRADGLPGLVVFLNAGDPGGTELARVLSVCDELKVDCVELAVPFPDSPTDGVVVRRSAERALAAGADLDGVLHSVARIRPTLRHTRIVLLADWSHSLRRADLFTSVSQIADAGCDAVLIHGLPPILTTEYLDVTTSVGLPVVSTCYHGRSDAATLDRAARTATAYVYLVSRYGRSGGPAASSAVGLADTVEALQRSSATPVAIGFGIKTRGDLDTVAAAGGAGAVVGTAAVQALEDGTRMGNAAASLRRFLIALTTSDSPTPRCGLEQPELTRHR